MARNDTPTEKTGITRRAALKGAAVAAGAAAGSGALTGFPTIWAQEIKDITLRHIGVSYSVVQAIGDQASKDLGFKIAMQNLDTSTAITRFITQPQSVDIPDLEGWQTKVAVARGLLQGIEVKTHQAVRQHPADLHQGRVRGPQGLAARHLAVRSDVCRQPDIPRRSSRACTTT